MNLISNWLNGKRNFITGRVLYSQFGNDLTLKNLLQKGDNPTVKAKLVKALEDILSSKGKTTNATKNLTRSFSSPPSDNTFSPPPIKDAVILALETEWKPKYQRMKYLQFRLDEFGQDNSEATRISCAQICKEILELEQECMVYWARQEFYIQNGKLPDTTTKESIIPTDPLKLATFITSCARQIRRYKKSSTTNAVHAELLNQFLEKYKLATGKDYEFKN